jgi:hypothetical protein
MSARLLPASAVLIGLVGLGLAALTARLAGMPIGHLTRDPQSTQDTSALLGAVSTLNNMAWAVAGALSLFVGWTRRSTRAYMVPFGTLMLVFAADDALLLHETVGPYVLGISELAFFGFYACLGLWILWLLATRARDVLLPYVLGGGFLAVSILFDLSTEDAFYLLEDGAKLLGTLVWITLPILAYGSRRVAPADASVPGTRGLLEAPRIGSSAPLDQRESA